MGGLHLPLWLHAIELWPPLLLVLQALTECLWFLPHWLSNKLTHILHGNSMDGHRGDQDRGRKEGKGGESGWSAYPRVKRKLDALREQEKASEEQKVIKKAREEQAAATQAMIQASIRQAFGSVPGGASLSSSAATPTGSHASSSASEEPVDAEEEGGGGGGGGGGGERGV